MSDTDRTAHEAKLIAAYRAMDDDTQREAFKMFQNLAREFPRREPPALRLIAGAMVKNNNAGEMMK